MQAIEYATNTTKDKLEEATELEQFHIDAAGKWADEIQKYRDQLDELDRAKKVLEENGF